MSGARSQQEFLRLFASLVGFALLFGGLGAGLIAWRAHDDPGIVALGPEMAVGMAEGLREDAAGAALHYWLIQTIVVTLLALLWLLLAALHRPQTPAEQRRLLLPWTLILLLALAMAFVVSLFVLRGVEISPIWRYALIIVALISTALQFMLTTAVGVKTTLVPSAPIARFVRR